jgi:hypothetical protein
LANFLRALTAIVEIADDRLLNVDNVQRVSGAQQSSDRSPGRIEKDWAELLVLASSLAQMAHTEIERLDAEQPNDPVTIENNRKQRALLVIFAEGFERIAAALKNFSGNQTEPRLLDKAKEVVTAVSKEIEAWFAKNANEVVDWGVRLPTFAAGVGMLGLVGADMTIATSAVAAIVGGTKVVNAIRGRK